MSRFMALAMLAFVIFAGLWFLAMFWAVASRPRSWLESRETSVPSPGRFRREVQKSARARTWTKMSPGLVVDLPLTCLFSSAGSPGLLALWLAA
jgi:hypothetical protein